MIDGVHRFGAGVRPDAHVAATAGLADTDVDPVKVAKLADCRAAGAADAAHFAGGKNHHRPLAFFSAKSADAAGGANQFTTLAGIHFDVVNFQASGDVGQRHGVADFRRRVNAALDGRADGQSLRGEDVGLLAVFVFDQGDEATAVRIIFDALDLGGDIVLGALEVDDAIHLLVAAA